MLGFDNDMLFRVPALLIALTVHEYAHAQAADSMGDPTPRVLGRLTLNPLAHLDPIGLLMLWMAGFGWAKPVPINPSYFRNGRQGMMTVSFAGPGANFFLAFLSTFLLFALAKYQMLGFGVHTFLRWTQLYNIWFGLFNLLPIPPLDGSKILMSLLPGRQAYALQRLEPYGIYIMIGIVALGVTGFVITPIARFILFYMQAFISLFF